MQSFQFRDSCRRGLTLIELLIVIAIIGVLIALTVVAVQRARESAARIESQNNMKNITLAIHQLADATGKLPRVPLDQIGNGSVILKPSPAIMVQILPFLEQGTLARRHGRGAHLISMYFSPADPTVSQAVAASAAATSYAANAIAFRRALPIGAAFPDGSSNTIMFAEHYAFGCGQISFLYLDNELPGYGDRRATFADDNDVEPVTKGSPPVTGPNTINPAITFQAAPAIKDCNPRVAQTPHAGGMIISMADGSVRVISPSISSPTYWALVTPGAGDTPGSDW
jgi:prepilin-type N-terminal cleavage/methylation domain-containing protein/prepilin-type processing-associated H-X9-DG protein